MIIGLSLASPGTAWHCIETWLMFKLIRHYSAICGHDTFMFVGVVSAVGFVLDCSDCMARGAWDLFRCDELHELWVELSESGTLFPCNPLLLISPFWQPPYLVFELPVFQWEASPWRVFIEVSYRARSCNDTDLLELLWEHMLLWMQCVSRSTKIPLSVYTVYTWLHLKAFVHRASVY